MGSYDGVQAGLIGTIVVFLCWLAFVGGYTAMIVVGKKNDGDLQAGLVAAGATGLVHCVLFIVICFASACCSDFWKKLRFGEDNNRKKCFWITAAVLDGLYISGLLAMIIAGARIGNTNGTALWCVGTVALIHVLIVTLIVLLIKLASRPSK